MNNDKYLAKTDIDNLETDDVGSQTKKVSLYAFDSTSLEKKRLTGTENGAEFGLDINTEGLATEEKQDDIISAINGIEVSSSEWVSALGADTNDATYYYIGYIKVGTFDWRIKRIAKADYSVAWASGTAEDETALATVWTNRAGQTYKLAI